MKFATALESLEQDSYDSGRKYKTIIDFVSTFFIIIFLASPWLLYGEEVRTNRFDLIAQVLFLAFGASFYPAILGVFWLKGRYSYIDRFAEGMLTLMACFVLYEACVLWPSHLAQDYSNAYYKILHPNGILRPQPMSGEVLAIYQRVDSMIDAVFRYFLLFLLLSPLLCTVFNKCGFGNRRNVFYLSLSLPGVIGCFVGLLLATLDDVISCIGHSGTSYLQSPLMAMDKNLLFTFMPIAPCIWLIVSGFQLYWVAQDGQSKTVQVRNSDAWWGVALILLYFWVILFNTLLGGS